MKQKTNKQIGLSSDKKMQAAIFWLAMLCSEQNLYLPSVYMIRVNDSIRQGKTRNPYNLHYKHN